MAGGLSGNAGIASGGRRTRLVGQIGRGPRRRRWLAGWAALLAVLVLLGGLEIHPAAEAHDPVAGLAGPHQDVYFPGASHPVQRPHAEAANAVQRPFCAACLNRLQGRGAHLAEAAHLATPLAGHPLPPAAAVAPLQKSLRPDGARAPPLA